MIKPAVGRGLNPFFATETRHGTMINNVHHPRKKRLKCHKFKARPANPIPMRIKKVPIKILLDLFFILNSFQSNFPISDS